MARAKTRDIAWESAATIRGKNPRAWRRDGRGNRIRYGSFESYGKYAWTLQRGKPVSAASSVLKIFWAQDRDAHPDMVGRAFLFLSAAAISPFCNLLPHVAR